jgi:ubiquinone/menaquinone biosynthesis C-methylase UbiE
MTLPAVAFRRFARLATNAVSRRPWLWRLLRRPLRFQFDMLAPQWDRISRPEGLDALRRALEQVPPPRRALDVGTGTGAAALAVAERFPDAEVTGTDLSAEMIELARAKAPDGHPDFVVGDAAALPFPDAAFDLVTLANAIPFHDELARVLAPDGALVFSFSSGSDTPIYVPSERLRRELGRRGFTQFAEFSAGPAVALVARR